jgi:hypothetical protein
VKPIIRLTSAGCLAVGLGVVTLFAQNGTSTAEARRAGAKAAAGRDHPGLLAALCPAPPREQWHAEPVKVFDSLYWLGHRHEGRR